ADSIGNNEGFLTHANPAFARIWGYENVDEVIGKPILDFLADKDEALEIIKSINNTGKWEGEYTALRKDGSTFIAWSSSNAVYDAEGNQTALYSSVVDITERKKAEEELRLERDNINNILEAMEDGVYIVNQEYEIEYVNPILKKDFGPPEGKKCYTYFHDRDEVCPWCKNQDVFAGETVRWEWYSFKNQKTYDLIDTPLKNPDGSISKLEIFRDITERKKAEERLQKSEEEKTRIRTLEDMINAMTDAVLVFNLEGVCTYANSEYTKLFGLELNDFLGKAFMEIPGIEKQRPEEIEKFMPLFESALEKGRAGPADITLITMDNREIPTSVAGGIIKDSKGNPTHIITVVRDITKRKNMENELIMHRDNLEKLVEERTSALQESEGKFRAVFNQAIDGIVLINLENGQIVDCNLEFTRLSGRSLDLLRTMKMWELRPPDKINEAQETYNKITQEGQAGLEELDLQRPDGIIIPIEFKMQTVNIHGKEYLLSIARDITERKKAEKKEKQYFQDLEFLSKAAMGFVELPSDNDIYQHIGKQLENIVKNSIIFVNSFDDTSDRIHVESVIGIGKYTDKVFKILGEHPVGKSFPIDDEARTGLNEGRLVKVPGKLHTLTFGEIPKTICHALEKLLNIGAIYTMGFTREGKLLGNVSIITRNGTELKNKNIIEAYISQASVALQRKRAEEYLKSSEERLKILFESAPDAYYINDFEGTFIDGNKAAEELLGYSREELIGKDFADAGILPMDKVERAFNLLAKNINGEATGPDEFTLNRKDGTKVEVEILTHPVKIGGEDRVLGIARDITERKRVDELQRVLLDIDNSINTCEKLDDLYLIIHRNLSQILETTNFFIALYNKDHHTLSFPYYVDEQDEYEVVSAEKTNCHYIIRTGEALLADREV
ncbi:MAG: PAS domain S-box protein, partial [Thermoplasmata archaeon]|nr:PAS domain S-box protein [Thermoplasmata archaeon]